MVSTTDLPVGFIEPVVDPDSAPWWHALDEGRFLVLRCRVCAHATFPLAPTCAACGSGEVEAESTAGSGVVYSWIEIHRALDPAFDADVPYTVLAVDLAVGPRVFGRLLGRRAGSDLTGLEVDLRPYSVGGRSLPGFVLRGAGTVA